MNEEVDKMEFETRMRQLMRELLEPLIYKSKVDREMIFKLEKTDQDVEQRIELLEQSVYNKNPETGTTMFDDMEKKLVDMDIMIKTTMKSFKEQVEFTEKKTMDEIFMTNQEVYKIKNYSEAIELNKQAIENLQFLVQSTVQEIRNSVETNKTAFMADNRLLQDKIYNLQNKCEKLPPLVEGCVSQCKTISELGDRLVIQTNDVIKKNLELETEKYSKEEHEAYNKKIQRQIFECEKATDKVANHADELQNWIDIYMPLRLQSQITETIKECLPRKGKYLLGIAASQMQAQLRERMFNDIGHPDLKQRCLKLIKDLQLEADILTEKDKQQIKDANENWKFDDEAEQAKKKANSEKFPKVESQQAHVGDADSEALGKLQEQLEEFTIAECKKVKVYSDELVQDFSMTTIQKLKMLDDTINAMNNQSSSFINALKDEVENSAFFQRKQNQDTLGLIKGLSQTMKKTKEQQNIASESQEKLKHTIHLIAQQQNTLSNFVTMIHQDGLTGTNNTNTGSIVPVQTQTLQLETENEPASATLSLKKAMTSAGKINQTQGRTMKADDQAKKQMMYNQLINDAQLNMKKLQVSLFKNNFKKSLIGAIGDSLKEQKTSLVDSQSISMSAAGIFEMPNERKPSLTTRRQTSVKKKSSIQTNTVEEERTKDVTPNQHIQTRIVTKQTDQEYYNSLLKKNSAGSMGPHTMMQNSVNDLVAANRLSEPDMGSSKVSNSKLQEQLRQTQNIVQQISSAHLDGATSLNDLDRRLDIKNNQSPFPPYKDGHLAPPKNTKVRNNVYNSTTMGSNSKNNHRYNNSHNKSNEQEIGAFEATSQSFDFSVLDPTLHNRHAKRGSMPVAINIQHHPVVKQVGPQSALSNYNKGPMMVQGNSGRMSNHGPDNSQMNQSFGFGPTNVSRAKYGSQEHRQMNQSMVVSGKKGALKQADALRQSVQEETRFPNI